jgi:orotate phosphoribosyltransferase
MATKQAFLELLLEQEVLSFGQFKTKSGRTSPYFFNTGKLCGGASIARTAKIYAAELRQWLGSDISYIYGPAYKGIPLAVSIAEKLADQLGREIYFTFNRKEAKDHGERGGLVGFQYCGGERVVVVEDVLTGGTSLHETLKLLAGLNVKVQGVLVGIDRQEKGQLGQSARREIEQTYHVPIRSVVNLDEIVNMLVDQEVHGQVWIDQKRLQDINNYRKEYGAYD